jgi:2-amino-4-hydroxy-6-hydroxymethyldihydropteridine diphosphokinase
MLQVTYPGETGGILPHFRSIALVAAGSNLESKFGSRSETILNALAELSRQGCDLCASSRFFSSPAFPPGSGPDFVNSVHAIAFDGAPAKLLERLHAVEADADRQRSKRWAARTLDLDLLAVGQRVAPRPEVIRSWIELQAEDQAATAPSGLLLPHPRIQDRAFVLVPLMDIAPEWVHPVLGKSVRAMLSTLPAEDVASVKPLAFSEDPT